MKYIFINCFKQINKKGDKAENTYKFMDLPEDRRGKNKEVGRCSWVVPMKEDVKGEWDLHKKNWKEMRGSFGTVFLSFLIFFQSWQNWQKKPKAPKGQKAQKCSLGKTRQQRAENMLKENNALLSMNALFIRKKYLAMRLKIFGNDFRPLCQFLLKSDWEKR